VHDALLPPHLFFAIVITHAFPLAYVKDFTRPFFPLLSRAFQFARPFVQLVFSINAPLFGEFPPFVDYFLTSSQNHALLHNRFSGDCLN